VLLAAATEVPAWANEAAMSSPKDLTPYARPAVPEDYALRGPQPSPRAGAWSIERIVDVVVDNTDPSLTTSDHFNDSEISIAVNPANPDEIVISAYSGTWSTRMSQAPLWYSTDGGQTWTKEFVIRRPPGVAGTDGCPCNQTVDYGRTHRLFYDVITVAPNHVYTGGTMDPADAGAWEWPMFGSITQKTDHSIGGFADQPWLLVNRDPTIAAQDNLYVAYDDFNGPAVAMRVSVSTTTDPPLFPTDNVVGSSTGAINPGLRLAKDPRNGYMYSLFQTCIANCSISTANPKRIEYVLNRSTDAGATWALNGSTTGIVVATADSTQPEPKFGTVNALLGGVVHATTDPGTGDLYYVYGNRSPVTGNNRLAIRRLVGDGAGGLAVGPEHFVTGEVEAALPSVAVTDSGAVGVFYYTFDGFSGEFPRFTTHLAVSTNAGATFTDQPLLTFLSSTVDSGDGRQRVFGDYMQLKAVENCFYGAFTGNGVAFGRPFANHDPIFYKMCGATGPTFLDVPTSDPFSTWIEALVDAGITTGCLASPARYCPDFGVTRAEMAVFLLRGIHGAGYQPPVPAELTFADLAASDPLAAWIEQFAEEGITSGCETSPARYCPQAVVTRAQMAVFLLRAKHGADYTPPAATGMFDDVPVGSWAAPWIEQLAREDITSGCGGLNFCPTQEVTRGQMAVFLVKTFGLPL
jgi:S-layer family protein